MSEQFTPRAKRLLVIMMVTPWLYLIVYYGAPMLNSQRRHLIAVERHIEKIATDWNAFQRTNTGLEGVHLFAYTGGDGMFGIYGDIWTKADEAKLRAFMENTKPPRPIYFGVRVFDLNEKDLKNDKPTGSTHGGDAIRTETNSTPATTGSGH